MPTVNTATDEISWAYDEVSAELKRMGLSSYPTAEDFTEEEITEASSQLTDYYLTKEVAIYNGETFTAAQVKTWAAFVDTLGKDAQIQVTHNGFKVVRPTTPEERRASALSDLASNRTITNRKMAERNLTRRYREEGEDAAGYKYDNGLTA